MIVTEARTSIKREDSLTPQTESSTNPYVEYLFDNTAHCPKCSTGKLFLNWFQDLECVCCGFIER